MVILALDIYIISLLLILCIVFYARKHKEVSMVEIAIGALILGYTGYIIYKKSKDIKAGKSCCGSCNSCGSKSKCK